MKINSGFILFLLFAFLIGCSKTPFSKDSSFTNGSTSVENPIISSNNISDDPYYSYNISDFIDYYNRIWQDVEIWCWKKEDGHWYCGFYGPNSGSQNPPRDYAEKMMSEQACPLYVMKEIINEKLKSKLIYIREVEYPLTDNSYFQTLYFQRSYPSKNVGLYKELDLMECFKNYYGDDEEYHYISDKFSIEKQIIYSKYFSYNSNIYCWKNEQGEYECGVGLEDPTQGLNYLYTIWMQKVYPCSLSDMKSIMNIYYQFYSKTNQNKIIEIPVFASEKQHNTFFADYPYEISSNEYLYNALGITFGN